jgi:hypothetical protein
MMNGIIAVAAVSFSFQCHSSFDFPFISCQFTDGAVCTQQPEITQDSYTELTEFLCSHEVGWCDNNQATKMAITKELRQLVTEPGQVEDLLADLKKGDKKAALLSFVNVPPHLFSPQYLDDIIDFDKSIKQIVGERRKLRQVFKLFPKFADAINLPETPPDSSNYPISSFAYKVRKGVKEIQDSMENLLNQESEILPFFSNHDVARAKFLKNVVEYGHKNRMIHETGLKVFTALCKLTDDNMVEAGYDSEGELCITREPAKPTQQKCGVLDETKNMAEAFLELREKIKAQLECDKQG